MELENFSIEKIKNYSMWFMLDKITQGPITMIRRTPAGDEPFMNFACFRMQDDHILIGINHFMSLTTKHNFYALSNGIEEIVNIQMFENIMDNYNVDIQNTNKGYFIFTDSISLTPELKLDWRCDNTMYGPMTYGIAEGVQQQLAISLDQLISYDPILSVDGIAHLVYIHFKNDAEYRHSFANELQLPFCGVTISEALKLISEWATVSQPPFNNAQLIAQDAKQFLDKLDFDWSLIGYQTDMYVAEYIKGNTNARMRPENVQPLSIELDLFIKKKMSYRCLSALISLYPDSWDLQEVLDNEQDALDFIHNEFFVYAKNINKPIALEIFRRNVEQTTELHRKIKTAGTF